MSSQKLKPCPFCGAKADVVIGGSHGDVCCSDLDGCGAEISVYNAENPYEAADIALERWNRRAEELAARAAYEAHP
jgi:Lar family restriction alleviation protein